MFEYKQILDVLGRKILDSRGYPAIEAEVLADDGTVGRASAAFCIAEKAQGSSGTDCCERRQLLELAAGEAAHHINTVLADAVIGENVLQQSHIDRILQRTEGDGLRDGFCRRAVLAVSLAAARAAAGCLGMPLFRYLGGWKAGQMPALQMLFNGRIFGAGYAKESLEIAVMPVEKMNCREAVTMGAAGYQQFQKLQMEGPDFDQAQDAKRGLHEWMERILLALRNAGYERERDFVLLEICGQKTRRITGPSSCQIHDAAPCPDQVSLPGSEEMDGTVLDFRQTGTVTELMSMADAGMYRICTDGTAVKTDDPFAADLSLALGAGWIRLGAPGDPAYGACYNRLLRIEEML